MSQVSYYDSQASTQRTPLRLKELFATDITGVHYKKAFHFSFDFCQDRPVKAQVSLCNLIRVGVTYQKTLNISP